jgi:cytoskeletal protein CcmA (bactofilin family)
MANQKNSQASITPTLISKGCIVTGKIESDTFVRIDGDIKGDLFIGDGLIVGENGHVEGNIQTRDVVVYGKINGIVRAESIDIKSSGKIYGEMYTTVLQVEKGAVYTGKVIMSKEKESPSGEHLVAVK